MPQFDFEYKIFRHTATNAIADCFEWKLCQSSFRGTGTQGTNQLYTKMLGQNFGAGITSRELYQGAILMTSSYRQKCLWPALPSWYCQTSIYTTSVVIKTSTYIFIHLLLLLRPLLLLSSSVSSSMYCCCHCVVFVQSVLVLVVVLVIFY